MNLVEETSHRNEAVPAYPSTTQSPLNGFNLLLALALWAVLLGGPVLAWFALVAWIGA